METQVIKDTVQRTCLQLQSKLRAAYLYNYAKAKGLLNNEDYKFPAHVPHLDGGTDKWGRNHKPVWPKLADLLLKNECLDAYGFMAFFFSNGNKYKKSHLCKQETVDAYKQSKQVGREVVLSILENDTELFIAACDKVKRWFPENSYEDVWKHVILAEDFQISPLFRYCVAYKQEFYTEADTLMPAALMQYLKNPTAYEQVWDMAIPQTLKDSLSFIHESTPASNVTNEDGLWVNLII